MILLDCRCLQSHIWIFTILLMFCGCWWVEFINRTISFKIKHNGPVQFRVKSIIVLCVFRWRMIFNCHMMYFVHHQFTIFGITAFITKMAKPTLAWSLVPTNHNHHHHPKAKPSCYQGRMSLSHGHQNGLKTLVLALTRDIKELHKDNTM